MAAQYTALFEEVTVGSDTRYGRLLWAPPGHAVPAARTQQAAAAHAVQNAALGRIDSGPRLGHYGLHLNLPFRSVPVLVFSQVPSCRPSES